MLLKSKLGLSRQKNKQMRKEQMVKYNKLKRELYSLKAKIAKEKKKAVEKKKNRIKIEKVKVQELDRKIAEKRAHCEATADDRQQ